LITRSVIACLVGTALVNLPQPHSPLVSTAYATLEVSTNATQTSVSSPSVQPAPKKRSFPSRLEAKSALSTTTSSKLSSKKGVVKRRIRPLGAFAVRAYTYEWDDNIMTRTASGAFPIVGRTVAVDPRVIPLGSTIYIEGLGERIAEDSGKGVKGKMLDLFLPSDDLCRQFGVRQHNVQIVEK
jgi:3D (Asp-Asp-Asp) domain-containing protein